MVSENNARMADLQAAFRHAGITNAGTWAREVDGYPPYGDGDTEYLKVRKEMAKYSPGPGLTYQIMAQLELP